jgi:hypothetical protein
MISGCVPGQGGYNDNNKDIRSHLLSVNLALFGNTYRTGESTFDYFLTNRSVLPLATKELVSEIFDFFDFDKTIGDELIPDPSSLDAGFGTLLQIFISKKLVDTCVYLAIPWGCPYTNDLGVGGYEFIKGYGYQAQISPIIQAIQSGTLPKGKFTKYALGTLQARIILGTDIMLNPNRGVKIFREVNLPKAKLDAYQNEIRKIAVRVMIDWLGRLISGKIPKEVIARLNDTPLAETIKDKEKASVLFINLRSLARQILPPPVKSAVPSKL